MSPVREKFIKIVESLPLELEEEIKNKKTLDILKEVTQKYVETYGVNDLSDSDKDIIQDLIGGKLVNED